jgi:hypothetical protein
MYSHPVVPDRKARVEEEAGKNHDWCYEIKLAMAASGWRLLLDLVRLAGNRSM